ncbi:putative mediator of RNA polymerase II transcription subunit 26 isoform X3 [Belonocnema kinseyi]|uniref:putative mediator of RNA polymerase II transcription subunit 26 isoform X3 n=1 Tax=Belonocnema kinseyi TaxID=2817044 RepID=UPI00143D55E3|nr:putative mediator of RNA polymerase II transcription subunit 26 isoform X3 [Belonocnema kinseyi]
MAYAGFDFDQLECQFGLRYRDVTAENEKGIVRGAANDKGTTKRGMPYTRGAAISFGFRRRPTTTGIPVPIASYNSESTIIHPRSKSAGPEHDRRCDEDNYHQIRTQSSSSGRSTPRLAPPKKESSGLAVRTNRFGFRHPQVRYTDKVTDVCTSHNASHFNQEKMLQQHVSQQQIIQQQHQDNYNLRQSRAPQAYNNPPISKPRPSPVNHPSYNNNHFEDRKVSGIPEPISKYTLQTSHLPLPQYAVRVNESNSKIAKTAANQSRKVSTNSRGCSSSKDGSGTEDSGVGSHHGYSDETDMARGLDFIDSSPAGSRRGYIRPRNLRMVVTGKSFDVRDVDDDSTVTEISVIPLPKSFATPANLNTGLVRERATHYQRILNKDNRYTDSTTSMSTTSSEGYDEGLGEEKVYKDLSERQRRSDKIPSIKSDFSPPSSDDPEYGHGEAMADEYSLSSSEECQRTSSTEQLKTISNAAKNGTLPKSTLRSVLLTIEDPAFAAVAATATTLIDDETSPVDSLFDSPTVSITHSDGKTKKEKDLDKSPNNDDDCPGTPTNASNSLSLSEGREYFDDEIEDQPGLVFDETLRAPTEGRSRAGSQAHTENSQTVIESTPKTTLFQPKSVENSPMHMRRVTRAGSIDTLSSCESIASDDLMCDYERSDASSYGDTTHRIHSMHDDDDVNELLDLEAQSEEVMREWSSLIGVHHANSNSTNNNANSGINNNNPTTESGISSSRTSRLLRSRFGTDSPRSLDNVRTRQVFSPLRPPRNVQSPSLDSGDEGSLRLERGTYQHMFQDIVSIKTMLLKLKRVLQEAETLNPFDNSLKNGLFYNLNEEGTTDTSTSPSSVKDNISDELTDLRRQVVFLQGQVEDKDRTIQLLQLQMTKHQGLNGVESQLKTPTGQSEVKETCNATTQTEKIRPVSAGPGMLQSLPQDSGMGPLVSWSDFNNHRPPLIAEFNQNKSRKSADRSFRMLRSPKEHTSNRKIGLASDISSNNISTKDTQTAKSVDLAEIVQELPIKIESSPIKSSIPAPRRLATSTLIPRSARAVSATGRIPGPDLGITYRG